MRTFELSESDLDFLMRNSSQLSMNELLVSVKSKGGTGEFPFKVHRVTLNKLQVEEILNLLEDILCESGFDSNSNTTIIGRQCENLIDVFNPYKDENADSL